MPKTCPQLHQSCSLQKRAAKKSLYSKNETILKIAKNGQNGKAIAHAKNSVWVRKWNLPKHAKNISKNTWKLFYGKNGWKKQLIVEKRDSFENCKKWPQCKGYSPCKTLSLGQKIKLPETCQKHLYKHIKVVLCKKRLEKTANIRKMRPSWKLPKMATMQRLKPMQNT